MSSWPDQALEPIPASALRTHTQGQTPSNKAPPAAIPQQPGSKPSTVPPAAIQASSPPWSGRTYLKPLLISRRATRAALASFGQVQ